MKIVSVRTFVFGLAALGMLTGCGVTKTHESARSDDSTPEIQGTAASLESASMNLTEEQKDQLVAQFSTNAKKRMSYRQMRRQKIASHLTPEQLASLESVVNELKTQFTTLHPELAAAAASVKADILASQPVEVEEGMNLAEPTQTKTSRFGTVYNQYLRTGRAGGNQTITTGEAANGYTKGVHVGASNATNGAVGGLTVVGDSRYGAAATFSGYIPGAGICIGGGYVSTSGAMDGAGACLNLATGDVYSW